MCSVFSTSRPPSSASVRWNGLLSKDCCENSITSPSSADTKQARVVRVLDVLLHQLPVARDALAVVAQDLQLAAVEEPVVVLQDRRSEVRLERLDVGVEGGEHHAAARGDLQLGEAVLLEPEVR